MPVLDEAERLAPCLEGLLAQGSEVCEMLVVDGGSRDATRNVVRAFMQREPRMRLVEAGRAPPGWNGKVWGLWSGERALTSRASWLLTMDADTRPAPGLVRALVERGRACQVGVLSVATAQRVSSNMDGLLHPSLLASLVYRFGRPNTVTRDPGPGAAATCPARQSGRSEGGFGLEKGEPGPHRDAVGRADRDGARLSSTTVELLALASRGRAQRGRDLE